MFSFLSSPIFYGIIGVILFGVMIYFITKDSNKKKDPFVNEPTSSSSSPIISYWNNYMTSDTRSKCFDCDRTSKYRHGSQCIDCETKGGRKVDDLLNRVLTR
jgi:hypothetical protein